jgi:hypothetical protein
MEDLRFCSSYDCPYRLRHGRPAEYSPGAERCSDCGASLQGGTAPTVKEAEAAELGAPLAEPLLLSPSPLGAIRPVLVLAAGALLALLVVRGNEASYDGWYWPNPDVVLGLPPNGNPPLFTPFAVTTKDFFGPPPIKEDPTWYPTGVLFEPLADGSTKKSNVVFPNNSFGSGYCLNCHASAAKFSTFVSLDNIVSSGLHYKFFASTDPSASPSQLILGASKALHSGETASLSATSSSGYINPFSSPLSQPGHSFREFYGNLGPVTFDKALPLRLPELSSQSRSSRESVPRWAARWGLVQAVHRLDGPRSARLWLLRGQRPMA